MIIPQFEVVLAVGLHFVQRITNIVFISLTTLRCILVLMFVVIRFELIMIILRLYNL